MNFERQGSSAGHPPQPTPPPEGYSKSAVILAVSALIAVAGFLIHAWVDLFAWTWDLWGKLIS